jgi:hypothetical protein
LWLALLDFPRDVAANELDPSWMRCLGHFLKNRYQCGADYVWTYGPLGYFVHAVYDADLFWWKYAWELGVKFAFAWLLLRWADLLRGRLTWALFVALLLIFLAGCTDALYLFGVVLLGLLPLRDEGCRSGGRLAAGTALLTVLSLTKFTFLLLGVAAWLVVVLAPGIGRWRRAALAAGFPLALATAWCLLGQAARNMAGFLSGSLEVAWGYGEAMAIEGITDHIYRGLEGVALFVVLVAIYPRPVLCRRESLLGLALVGVSLFLVWKHGFVRQVSHTGHFFNYLLLVPFALEGLLGGDTGRRLFRAGLVAALVVIALDGRGASPQFDAWLGRLRENGATVLAPARLRRSLDERQDELADEWALPAIRRLADRQPVDQISTAQGVLLLNRMDYRPRPVFQSYSAYTPQLLARNAAFYRSERAPTFVLWKLDPIDGHMPAMEDGPTLLEVFRRYRPAAREKGFLLLKRLPDTDRSGTIERSVLRRRSVTFEEEVRVDDLGSAPKTLTIRIEDSPRGRLTKFLFRPPPLFLDLHTRDGQTYSYRLIPGLAGADFLLDPLLRDDQDVTDLYAGRPLLRVRAFSIRATPEARACYRDRLSITVCNEEGITVSGPPRD